MKMSELQIGVAHDMYFCKTYIILLIRNLYSLISDVSQQS